MKSTLTIISGWAHGLKAITPLGDALSTDFKVTLLTGNQVLQEQKIPDTDFIVTGSMGGLLAIEHLPATCKKLVLLSSTAKFCAGEGYPCGTHEKVLKRMILQLKRKPKAVLEQFYKNVHDPAPAIATDPECSLDELVAGLEYLLASDVREKVPSIGIPTLTLHGADDLIIPVNASTWLTQHFPNARQSIFENTGHALNPKVSLPLILDFLSSQV